MSPSRADPLPSRLSGDGAVLSRGVSVIVLRRDAVLMVERGRPPFEGLWSFPGGRLEPGETAEAGAARELAEETSVVVGRLILLGSFRPTPSSPWELEVFCARAGECVPRAGDDARCAEFVPLNQVLERHRTPGAVGWLVRAIRALAEPDVGPLDGC